MAKLHTPDEQRAIEQARQHQNRIEAARRQHRY